jgi:histidinol dehydrogenase
VKYIKTSSERPAFAEEELRRGVAGIIEDVRKNGEEALLRYNRTFDQSTRERLRVTRDEIEQAWREVAPNDADDIRQAADNIRAFAKAQRETLKELPFFSPFPGVTLGHRIIPVRSCCCYVPGGGYPLYSTALMLAIPAAVAGVQRIVACSPVLRGTNSIHPKTLVAMDVAGVHEIYAVGGAQAIAAFSWGAGRIEPVDLIVGPGNRYVTEAKRQCYGQVGIDFVAGPSEVLIIVDRTADAELVAADLLAQCEHDRTAKGIVVTTDRALGEQVAAEVERLLENIETAEVARQAWKDYGEIILVDSLDEAVAVADEYAPEHLEIQADNDEAVAQKLHNYGSLFIGKFTAEVFGDYASGTNHTLPTLRAARYTGGVWVGTFLKTCTHQIFTREAMLNLSPLVSRLARGEGLVAHARAAEIRQKKWSAGI